MDGQAFVLTVEASGEVTPAAEPGAEESPEREEMADG